jgi:hypothetical protein
MSTVQNNMKYAILLVHRFNPEEEHMMRVVKSMKAVNDAFRYFGKRGWYGFYREF